MSLKNKKEVTACLCVHPLDIRVDTGNWITLRLFYLGTN